MMGSRGTQLLERSSNPTLRQDVFRAPPAGPTLPAGPGMPPDPFAVEGRMTVRGVINKTALLLVLVVAAAAWAWTSAPASMAVPLLFGGVIVGLALVLVTVFRPRVAPVTAPIYAVVEGVVLGIISELYEAGSSGIAVTAVALTFATMAAMLLAYTTGLIRVTRRFRAVVITATLGILVTYLVSLLLSAFGARLPLLNDPTPLGILISLVIVAVAALNLVLDFDFIAQGAANGAPKRVEWYGAFSLLVTLIWLYLELLRLLGKLRR
jgi:uncharacterized YccA/Bax inhibitor family protein